MTLFITKETLQRVYSNGMNLRDLSNKLGYSSTTVSKYLRLYGFKVAKGRPKGGKNQRSKVLIERDNRIVELRKSGKTLGEIGEEFNISRERVRQVLLRNGIKGWRPKKVKPVKYHPCKCGCNTLVIASRLYAKGHHNRIRHELFWEAKGVTPELVKQLYDKGATIAELADKFDVHLNTMLRYMEKHSIPRMAGIPKAISRGTFKTTCMPYEVLYQLHVVENLTVREIAKRLGRQVNTVYLQLAKCGIPCRPRGTYGEK